ncbi:MAG: sigma-54 dependent transcriptional regulator [Anaerovoracaceae bacterium]|nr:sigma-54 dependent transcriptional regulator [Anaerovoracaceae bacterium]
MNQYLKILVVDDEADSRETYKMLLESQGYTAVAASSAEEALAFLEQEFCHIILSDIMMPGMDGLAFLQEVKTRYQDRTEVIMTTGYGSIETAVEAMKRGAFSYFVKSHNPDELLLELEKAASRLEMANMKSIRKEESEKYLLGSKNPAMEEVWKLVDLVANSSANVLITGESGTGKEIVAEEIHQRSDRSDKPFIAINCQQYPHELIESELFGHEKGAYTGAVSRRIGKLEQAAGGTVFLDEIGDLSMDVQVMLLRVLEKKEIERIGSNTVIPVDFRLVTATNRPLEEMVREKTFRQDFLYRINTIEIKVPPLRQRREDLPDFIRFFVHKYEKETGKRITGIDDAAKDWLLHQEYAGNIRELKNIIERMVILSGSSGILTMEGGAETSASAVLEENRNAETESSLSYKEARANFDRQFILDTLQTTNGNITKAAEKMGLSRRQLFNKIVELQIDVSTMK